MGLNSLPPKAKGESFYIEDLPRSVRGARTAVPIGSTILIREPCSMFVSDPTIGPGDNALIALFVAWSRYP